MIKGHVTIDLHNHQSGFTERIEQDNLVTDAVGILASAYAGANMTDKFMPIAKKALGGLMLFDDTLEEDAANIYFPGDAHLVGFAGQWNNTSNPLCGSLNVQETHATDTGYETVWDFSTSQANGVISALALTAEPESDIINNQFTGIDHRISMHNLNIGNNLDIVAIANSPEQMMYTLVNDYTGDINNYGIIREYDPNRKIYTSKFKLKVYKEYVPIKEYKVADHINMADVPEQIKEIELKIESKKEYFNDGIINPKNHILNAYDGHAYMVYSDGNDSGDGHFTYQRIKLSDYSFDVEDQVEVSLPNTSIYGGLSMKAVCRGKCFLAGKDARYIYIVDLANTADIKTADLGEGWKIIYNNSSGRFYVEPGGTVKIEVKKGENIFSEAIIYPDGKVILNRERTSANYIKKCELVTDSLIAYNEKYGYPVKNYLGTICNLTTPITKTAATSMKITYTLTDEV